MLESMLKAARPTRAEANDVANAIHDGTDAIMLSGETATGAYPIEATKMMARLAEKTDPAFEVKPHVIEVHSVVGDTPTDAVAQSAVRMAHSLKAKAIVCTTTSGTTPRMVSKYRPRVPILCACWDERAHRQMAIVRGVESLLCDLPSDTDESIDTAIEAFMRVKRLKVDDLVVVTAGVPAGQSGNTNLIYVRNV
jgi:pyruvate kinase